MSGPTPALKLATECIQGRRPYNEDGVLTTSVVGDRALLAVADGMGGHAAGEVASAMALEALQEAIEMGHTLEEAFHLANERVFNAARSDLGRQGMGTTMVAFLVDGEHYEVANVGDSRGYVISREGIEQVTEDHSFVAEAMRRGQPEEEARLSKWKDALTRSIGTAEQVEVDTFGPFPLAGDLALVLCSDGLYKTLRDHDVEELFSTADGVGAAVEALVTVAYDRGSDDNISVVIGEHGDLPRRAPSPVADGNDGPAATLILDTPMADSEAGEDPDAVGMHSGGQAQLAYPGRSGVAWIALASIAVVILAVVVAYLI